jgi:non-lysosomal glucosylceramidase
MRHLFFLLTASFTYASPFSEADARHERARQTGFQWTSKNTFPDAYTSRTGATDDGAFGLPAYGGIGTGCFARDLHGHFDRWQLQPGFPRKISINAASLCLQWRQGQRSAGYRIGEAGWDKPLPAGSRSVAVQWPVISEKMTSPEWPVEVLLESWSPVVPQDYAAAAMPVAFFDFYIKNTSSEPAELDAALFMPNFLGWRKGVGNVNASEAEQKPNRDPNTQTHLRSWPERSNSGNYATETEPDAGKALLSGVTMQRSGYTEPTQDVEGQIQLAVSGDESVRAQSMLSAMANGNRASAHGSLGLYFVEEAAAEFFKTGKLPTTRSWHATATEVLTSAVAGGLKLAAGQEGKFTLVITWDTPLVQFGSGRTWEKAYTAHYGADGKQARRITLDALAQRDAWREKLDQWHRATLGNGDADAQKRHGAALNDLYYVVSGGSTWVAKEKARPGMAPPLLGSGEHFSILEGFDTGYYFSSTFDLWPHAQAAFEAHWPRLAGLYLDDFLKIAPLTCPEPRLIFNTGEVDVRKPANKIPHDIGCPSGDPWHLVNEYNTTRNSNVWKDHNPEFIISLYLHRKHQAAPPPTDSDWKTLLALAAHMEAQDTTGDGLPFHNVQGDNTWDALHFTGPSPYSGGLTIAAYAALADWANQRQDNPNAEKFATRLSLAQQSFEKHFWNGSYYRGATNGKEAEWILCDALLGILLADSAGLKNLLPAEHIASHLRKAAERNGQAFGSGRVGPSLLAPPQGPIPSGKVQIGEVIVGSARSCIALMQRYGVSESGNSLAKAINRTLYEESGLQFRTPAAWNELKNFRAPSNLRPLASWHSLWPKN